MTPAGVQQTMTPLRSPRVRAPLLAAAVAVAVSAVLKIRVPQARAAVDQASGIAEQAGGYVALQESTADGRGEARVVMKVPPPGWTTSPSGRGRS